MRFLLSWVITVGLALPMASAAQPPASVVNFVAGWGEFDKDADGNGISVGWEADGMASEVSVSVDSEIKASGQSSQRFDARLLSPAKRSSTISRIERPDRSKSYFKGGQRLTATFKTRGDVSRGRVKLWLFLEYGKPNWDWQGVVDIAEVSHSGRDSEWETHRATFTVPRGQDWAKLKIRVGSDGGPAVGTVWIDDLVITDQSPRPLTKRTTIRNWLIYAYTLSEPVTKAMDRFEGGRFESHFPTGTLQQLRPDGMVSLITRASYTGRDAQAASPTNPFTIAEVNREHPEWVLRDVNGKLMADKYWVALDVGNKEYQRLWAERMVEHIEKQGYRWVFFDTFDAHARCSFTGAPYEKYPTDAAWQKAATDFLKAVVPKLQAAGAKVILNLAHTSWLQEPGKTWMGIVDGGIFELAFVNSDGKNTNPDSWESWRVKHISVSRSKDKVSIMGIRAPLNDAANRRFGIASYLVSMTPLSYLFYCVDNENQVWHPDLGVDIGKPLGDAKVTQGNLASGGLFVREFERGLALVNPSDNLTFTHNLQGSYRDLDGRRVSGKVTLEAKEGLILIED